MCNKNANVPVTTIPKDERVLNLCNIFYQEYGSEQDFVVKVPGRVNIIGEHIDYCGYPVLPLALEQDILIAVKISSDRKLCIKNVDNKYNGYDIVLETFQKIEIISDIKGKPYWYNYILCGIKGAMEFLSNNKFQGLKLLVDGNIPPASGLSSSSALVSAACLSFLYAQDALLDKVEIASLCAKSERYIGTQGGGMDQAIAFLAEKYCAQYITFKPLKAQPVSLPENAIFVVAHSFAEANKAATNDFNRRVIECRLAGKLLLASNGTATDRKIVTLSEVQTILKKTLDGMVDLVDQVLTKSLYTKSEICDSLKITEEELNDVYLTSNTKHINEFKLRQRALHVYMEAKRVETFRKVCQHSYNKANDGLNGSTVVSNGNGCSRSEPSLAILGNLMSESHKSLKNLYECSHHNLDRLVEISQEMNVSSRLTGAGWGGCIVALCPKELVEEYIHTLIEKFYVQFCNIDKSKAMKYVFATTPNHGAIIYTNKI